MNSITLDMTNQEHIDLLPKIYKHLNHLTAEYPDFEEWFYEKVIPGLYNKTRYICIIKSDSAIAGILILKDSENEKKICTLRISKNFRSIGIGRSLLEKSFEILNTKTPIITVPDTRLQEFLPMLLEYGFKLEANYFGYYKPERIEYSFNGTI